jgi:outer membrane receptor protein involved in Fe transport
MARFHPYSPLYLLALALCLALPLQAQDEDSAPVFELNPFVVETGTQDGYLAANSNSGTRLSQAIKDLPIPVEVITGEFIEDIGALDVMEALQFSAGLETVITSQQIGENTSNPNAFRLRGYVSEAVMRSGFRVIGATDSVNIAQVDVVRGPNALLYGIGNFGGVVNYITSRPTPEFRSKAGVTIGSWNFLRFQAQARGPVGEKNGYSIGAFTQSGDDWVDHANRSKEGVSLLWEYKPFKNTTITFEAEYIYQESANAENPLSESFLSSVTDGEDLIDPSAFPQSLLDFDGTDIYADPDSRRGFLRTPSDSFRWAGRDVSNEITDTTFTLNLTHNFSEDLSLQVGINQVRRDKFNQDISLSYSTDLQNILANSETGERLRQDYPWMYLPQHPQYDEWVTPQFQSLKYSWGRSQNEEVRKQARAEFVYSKEIAGIGNSIVAGMTYNEFTPNMGASYALKDTSRPMVSPTQSDLSGLQNARPRYQSVFDYTPIGLQLGETEEWVETRGYRKSSEFWERGYYVIHQGKFWRDKIHTVVGLRYDWIDTASPVYWQTTDEGYDPSKLGTIKEYRKRADGPSSDTTTSIGVSYAPIDALSIFVLRASALQPIYNQVDARGFIPEPISGISNEIGIKFDLLETKISGAISIYKIERDGVVLANTFGNARYPRSDPDDINVDQDWLDQGRGNSGDLGLKQDRSEGVDMQVYLTNLIQGLQSVVNFSYNKYEWERFYGWSFVRKEGSGETAEFIFEELDNSDTINPNRKYNDTPEFSFRVWNKYVFGEGPLEGLSLGLGFNWTDEREATFQPARETLKAIPARTEWSAAITYGNTWKDIDWSAQLNIYNLTDETGVSGYNYLTPLSYRLSLNLTF